MLGRPLIFAFHFHGTLAANGVGRFQLPVAATLKEIQFSCAGATAATLDCGPAADVDGIMNDGAIGQSDVPAIFDRNDFNGALYTDTADIDNMIFAEDTVFHFTITHASAVNADLVFVFEA